ncbi:MAG TPA: alginate export family protein [Planctomycetota bacterium]|nr:alginate export family protein [Planctomycetota bacterium]
MNLIALILCPLLTLPQDKPPAPAPAPVPAAAPQEKAPASPPPPATQAEPFFKTMIKGITFGGQIRERAEYRDPTSYLNTDAATRSDDVFLSRIRLNLKFSVTDDIDVFVQPQDQRAWGQEASVLNDERNLDLHQGFVEVRNLFSEPISIKAGRMELQYGDQRLISPLDWSNIGRAWDGAKIRYAPKDWWIEAFYTVIRDPLAVAPAPGSQPAGVANGAAEDQDFGGIYFSYIGIADHEFDVYAFFREFQDNSFVSETGAVGDLVDRTVGARIKGRDLGFDYTLEAMSQTGQQAGDRIQSYAFVATLGYTFDMDWTPRIGVEYDHASGDRHAGDGQRNTFDPLFPFNHYYQGFADIIGFRNSKDLSFYLSVKPADTVVVSLDWHNFWLTQDEDAWYNDNGTVVRPGVASGIPSTRLAHEFDLHAKVTVSKYVKFWGGWSHVFAGPYIRQTATAGTDTDLNWFFLQMVVDF